MTLTLRPMPLAEVQSRLSAGELARQKRSCALLGAPGVRGPASEVDLLTGRVIVWECVDGSLVAGQCTGDCLTGEILSLEVQASHEGRGIGRTLLFHVASRLRAAGAGKVWLIGPADRRVRAHGFYRAVGCRPAGAAASGDDILEVPLVPLQNQAGHRCGPHAHGAERAGGQDAKTLDTSPAPGRARSAGRRPADARRRRRVRSASRTLG